MDLCPHVGEAVRLEILGIALTFVVVVVVAGVCVLTVILLVTEIVCAGSLS